MPYHKEPGPLGQLSGQLPDVPVKVFRIAPFDLGIRNSIEQQAFVGKLPEVGNAPPDPSAKLRLGYGGGDLVECSRDDGVVKRLLDVENVGELESRSWVTKLAFVDEGGDNIDSKVLSVGPSRLQRRKEIAEAATGIEDGKGTLLGFGDELAKEFKAQKLRGPILPVEGRYGVLCACVTARQEPGDVFVIHGCSKEDLSLLDGAVSGIWRVELR